MRYASPKLVNSIIDQEKRRPKEVGTLITDYSPSTWKDALDERLSGVKTFLEKLAVLNAERELLRAKERRLSNLADMEAVARAVEGKKPLEEKDAEALKKLREERGAWDAQRSYISRLLAGIQRKADAAGLKSK